MDKIIEQKVKDKAEKYATRYSNSATQFFNAEEQSDFNAFLAGAAFRDGLDGVEKKALELLELTDEFIFPSFYSHTGKKMWKISNVYTKYGEETLVLCGVDEGIERAIELAIEHIAKKRNEFYF